MFPLNIYEPNYSPKTAGKNTGSLKNGHQMWTQTYPPHFDADVLQAMHVSSWKI